MNGSLSTTRMRLERLSDERERTAEKIEDALALAEEEKRPLEEFEQQQIARYREQIAAYDEEIDGLVGDLERAEGSRDVSALLRGDDGDGDGGQTRKRVAQPAGVVVYRTFAQYARDQLIVRYPQIAALAAGGNSPTELKEAAGERLERVVANTLSSDVAGLLPPQHMAQIMDIITTNRPVVSSARALPLETGKLTYPKIGTRPTVGKQTTEKTETASQKMTVTLEQLAADTYLGAGDLSWQTINWSTPDALQLWFDLAAEDYARKTETAACTELNTNGGGTITAPLGTAGTESFAQWRAAIIAGIAAIYSNTGGRAQTNTLWLAADRFFQLAALGTDQTLQISSVGSLDVATMRGTYAGLRVIGSYGFTAGRTVVGDSSALLVAETAGAPIEMRAVEPAIGGLEVGVIGGFQSKVFDSTRFIHLN